MVGARHRQALSISAERGAAGQRHAHLQFFAQAAQHVGHAERARHRQRIQLQAPDHHGVGAQRQRLEDVGAAADAAVEQQREVARRRRRGWPAAHPGWPARRRGRARRGWTPRCRPRPSRSAGARRPGCSTPLTHTGRAVSPAARPDRPSSARPPWRPGRCGCRPPASSRRPAAACGARLARHAIGRHAETGAQRAAARRLDDGIEGDDDGADAGRFGAPQQRQRGGAAGLKIQLEPVAPGALAAPMSSTLNDDKVLLTMVASMRLRPRARCRSRRPDGPVF